MKLNVGCSPASGWLMSVSRPLRSISAQAADLDSSETEPTTLPRSVRLPSIGRIAVKPNTHLPFFFLKNPRWYRWYLAIRFSLLAAGTADTHCTLGVPRGQGTVFVGR